MITLTIGPMIDNLPDHNSKVKKPDVTSNAPSSEGVPPCQSDVCHAIQGVPVSKKSGGISRKQLRSLKKQVSTGIQTSKVGKKYAVVEVFCPPRFVPEVERMGLKGLSMDTSTGWNLDDPKTQEWVCQEMQEHPPELMVPPMHQCRWLVPS